VSKYGFVFPGQGSQATGMLADLAQKYSLIEEVFDEASQALGYDLWDVVQNDDTGRLNSTDVTQPALLTSGVALFRLWKTLANSKAEPAILAGHSLGEYTALTCAGSLDLDVAVRLVEARGQFMQQAVAPGAGKMAAVLKVEDAIIEEVCGSLSSQGVISPVNYNSPGQVVIAGEAALVDSASALLKERGARVMPLAVSVPSHCNLMQPAAEKLKPLLEATEIKTPNIPVINNVDVAMATEAAAIKDALIRQLYCPVRWTEIGQYLAGEGVNDLYELGPGKVLSGLMKRIDGNLACSPLGTLTAFEGALEI